MCCKDKEHDVGEEADKILELERSKWRSWNCLRKQEKWKLGPRERPQTVAFTKSWAAERVSNKVTSLIILVAHKCQRLVPVQSSACPLLYQYSVKKEKKTLFLIFLSSVLRWIFHSTHVLLGKGLIASISICNYFWNAASRSERLFFSSSIR